MHTRKISIALALATLLAVPAYAVTITFEGLAPGTVVDNQYLALGVDFNSTTSILTAGVNLNPAFPPFSGVNVGFDSLGTGIEADAVAGVWTFVSGRITGNTAITLSAYDSANNLLGSVSTPGANFIGSGGPPPNYLLSLAFSHIAYVTFTDSGNTFTLDDFTFTQVPEPVSMVLVGSGLLGLAARSRARKNRA